MAPQVKDQIDVLSPPILPLASKLSLDPALKRLGAVDGGWWPRSHNANVELPGLVSSLNARVGRVVRLGVDARDPQGHILLLVAPPQASTAAAKSALALAATGKYSGRPEEIMAASGIENAPEANPPRAVREKDDHSREREFA